MVALDVAVPGRSIRHSEVESTRLARQSPVFCASLGFLLLYQLRIALIRAAATAGHPTTAMMATVSTVNLRPEWSAKVRD